MKVNPENYQIPEYSIHIDEMEYLKLSKHQPAKLPNFDLQANRAVELFNSRCSDINISTKTHWFKLTQELSCHSETFKYAKLEAYKR